MTCDWCHEFTPPNRKDGYCSDICQINYQKVEIARLRAALEEIAKPSYQCGNCCADYARKAIAGEEVYGCSP